MKLKERWRTLTKWQKLLILLRDLTLYTVLLSALPRVLSDYDNSLLVLICLPVSAIAQAILSWKRDRKTALFFLFAAIFVFGMYLISLR